MLSGCFACYIGPVTTSASSESSADRRMVVLVREAKGLSQRELAALADLNQSTISKVENGLAELKGETLREVARALDCPVDLLTHPASPLGLDVSCLHHRRRSSRLTAVAKSKIQALAHLSRLSIEQLIDGQPLVPVDLPRVAELDAPDPVEMARVVREHLNLPLGPVEDLIGALEAVGVIVFERPLGSAAQDAVSSWPQNGGRVPILVISSGLSGDRQRFTIAHELGHLVMHRIPGDEQENQADMFAASLLAPPEEIRPDLAGLTTAQFRRLVELKPKWKISIAALIRRAYDIGEISDRQYREFQLRLNRLGWKTAEPIEVPPERPSTLRDLLQRRLLSGEAIADVARTALMTEDSFRRYFPVEPRDSAMTA